VKKYLKICLPLAAAVLLTTGCFWSKAETGLDSPPGSGGNSKQTPKADTAHINLTKDKVTFTVSKTPKYFDKNMIVPEEGMVIAGLSITLTNDTPNDLLIDPKYGEITTNDGQKHTYSETKTVITGKGAFKTIVLPPTYRGGGLLLFEIKDKAQIQSVKYDDQKGHVFNVTLLESPKKL
jgi:hypothetical protein